MRAIRSNSLRTILTLLIIAFGIMALVGILTSIESLKSSLASTWSIMGANTFSIRQRGLDVFGDGGDEEEKPSPNITYEQAVMFKERFNFPGRVSLSGFVTGMGVLKYESKKTNQNVRVVGVDENYLYVSGYEMGDGRFFTPQEARNGDPVVVIGENVRDKIFAPSSNPVNEFVSMNGRRYKVIGVLRSKGSSRVSSSDNTAMIPLLNAVHNNIGYDQSYGIAVAVSSVNQVQAGVDEATGLMRNIRRQRLDEPDNFACVKSDAIIEQLNSQLAYLTFAALVIGIITLIGAATGLMNIMLVSVTERTREIGVSKALGATKKVIRRQFVMEAIVICQIGGIVGIILGTLAGNGVSLLIGGSFVMPWFWIIMGLIFCFIVGLGSGIYPAVKASNLDPIDALRYE